MHVAFEGPGTIEAWATAAGHELTLTRVYEDNVMLPAPDEFDLLLVMGGPMSAYHDAVYPWLGAEKQCIRAAIAAGRRVLGICLGAQLAAEALGGVVKPLGVREIGWWPVQSEPEIDDSPLGTHMVPFHWHGDTFSIPAGARRLAGSAACPNQAFDACDGRVLGLQFHPELEVEHIAAIIDRCGLERRANEQWVQPTESVLDHDAAALVRPHFWQLLDRFVAPL